MPRSAQLVAGPASAADFAHARNPRLSHVIRDAARHVPLYRALWAASGIDVDGAPDAADFLRLPILDKPHLLGSPPADRLHDGWRDTLLSEERSSGSSGQPLAIFKDRSIERARRWAFLRALATCGYRPGQRCLFLTSRRSTKWPSFTRWSYAGIGEDTDSLVARLENVRPDVLYGPLSTLELLAERYAAGRVRGGTPRLVVATAEQMTRMRRAALERAFGACIADFYGMTEFGLMAFRGPGRAAYVSARRSLILEHLPVRGDNEVERLVVTDLAARVSPLIRYDTGDLVRRDRHSAGCPIVEFAGRAFDCLATPGGERLSPYRLDVVLEQVPGLAGFEVLQHADLALEVRLELKPGEAADTAARVRRDLESVLGRDLPIRIEIGRIDRGPPGSKFRPIRSLVRVAA